MIHYMSMQCFQSNFRMNLLHTYHYMQTLSDSLMNHTSQPDTLPYVFLLCNNNQHHSLNMMYYRSQTNQHIPHYMTMDMTLTYSQLHLYMPN